MKVVPNFLVHRYKSYLTVQVGCAIVTNTITLFHRLSYVTKTQLRHGTMQGMLGLFYYPASPVHDLSVNCLYESINLYKNPEHQYQANFMSSRINKALVKCCVGRFVWSVTANSAVG